MILMRFEFETGDKLDSALKLFEDLQKHYPDEEIVAVPTNVDLMFNCTLDDLIDIRDKLDKTIERIEEKENES